MRHPSVPFFALALFLTAAQAAPVPKPRRDDRVLYHPTRVGDVSVYQQDETEFTSVVTAVEDRAGDKVVSVDRVHGHGFVFSHRLAVSEEGLAEARDGSPEARDWLVRLPAGTRGGWEADFDVPGHEYRARYTVHGPERVTVPAGTFTAVRVEVAFSFDGKPAGVQNYWYAPGLGEVKWTAGGHARALKSFTPGKG